MKDRVLTGFIAGILAAIGTDIANWVLFSLNLTEVRFLDWASAVFLGYIPATPAEVMVTQLTQIVWDGLLGVLFAMLLPVIKPDYLIYKGMMFAFALFFVFRAITVIYDVTPLNNISLSSFLSNIVCSIIWGLLVALVIKKHSAVL